MPAAKKMECPICRGMVSTSFKAETLTDAMHRHIRLTHAIQRQGPRSETLDTLVEISEEAGMYEATAVPIHTRGPRKGQPITQPAAAEEATPADPPATPTATPSRPTRRRKVPPPPEPPRRRLVRKRTTE